MLYVGNVPAKRIAEELIANQFNILVSKMDDYFVSILNNESIIIDEQLYELFLKTFQNYNQFAKIGDVPFLSLSTSRINRQALNYLRMHFKWVVKSIRKLTVEIAARFPAL